jgi:hypothetical protein
VRAYRVFFHIAPVDHSEKRDHDFQRTEGIHGVRAEEKWCAGHSQLTNRYSGAPLPVRWAMECAPQDFTHGALFEERVMVFDINF